MSAIGDALFGSEGTPSQVVDTTPEEFARLRPFFANFLQNQARNPATFGGPFAAPVTQGEQQGLQGVQQAAGQVGQGQNPLNAIGQIDRLGQTVQFGQNPLGQQLVTGAAGFNPFAGLSGLEQSGLGQVTGRAFAPSVGGQALGAINQTAFGQNPLTGATNQTLQNIISGQNPLTDRLIQAAQRPILDQFSDEALRQRGLFTGAGQTVQGQGSSPFAQASARLVGNVGGALNDAALGVTNQAFQQQLGAIPFAQAQPGIQLQSQLAAGGFGEQVQGNALARALSGLGAAGIGQNRLGQAFESQQGRQLQAGSQIGQQQLAQQQAQQGAQEAQQQLQLAHLLGGREDLRTGQQIQLAQQQAQLGAQLQNLQAQGLPRLVEQLGIEGGLAEFQRQQQQITQIMQLLGGVTSPSSQVLPGTAGTEGIAGDLIGAAGTVGAAAIMASDRRLKQDIEHVATSPAGTELYRFKYIGGNVEHTGVMADEVEHIPGAVIEEPITGIKLVDYSKVV